MPMAAFIVDHQNSPSNSNLKHFCKICKKGFGCGRALGGHMRAHGIGIGIGMGDDSSGPMDDDDPASDWDDNKPIPTTNRRMYALRTNPNRLKTCRVCHNCGKEFLSWKSFLEHGKCTATDDDLDVDDSLPLSSGPTCSDDDDDDDAGTGRRGCGGNNNWSKRKRSLRVKVGSPNSNEEEDLANCLMMLSNGAVDRTSEEGEEEAEESCASASKEEHHHQDRTMTMTMTTTMTSNIIRKPLNFIPPISYRVGEEQNKGGKGGGVGGKGMFECKACKKVFNSHQALGGHRASHKKVKGCFAARLEQHMDLDPQNDDVLEDSLFFPTSKSSYYDNGNGGGGLASTSKMRKTKVHECSICHRIFSSGQALGGHKRCHWITSNAPAPAPTAEANASAKNNVNHHFHDHATTTTTAAAAHNNSSALVLPLDLKLDLNLPAPSPAPAPAPSFQAVSTDIYLQSWASCKTENKCHPNHNRNQFNKNNNNDQLEDQNMKGHNNNNSNGGNPSSMVKNKSGHVVEDEEADSKVKLAKLSDLKDMNMSGSGNSSPWLQVGIGSTTDHLVTPDHP